MKTALISLTENGRILSEKIAFCHIDNLEFKRFAFYKNTDNKADSFDSISRLVTEIFNLYDALVFISSCGIAVRAISSHIVSKYTDPAVLVIDEQGKYTISLLSGHIGGANALAVKIAEIIGSQPVITTATDVGGKFSPDSFATANSLYICEKALAKQLAAKAVNNEPFGFISDYPVDNIPEKMFDDSCRTFGVHITDNINSKPFEHTLHLIPKNIVLGIGCKKNTEPSILSQYVIEKLNEFQKPIFRVKEIHSIDLKKNEEAVLSFGRQYNIPVKFYSSDQLMKIKGTFSHSEFVMKTTGTDNVCERSAAADGGKIIIPKQAANGITMAAAEISIRPDFERNIL